MNLGWQMRKQCTCTRLSFFLHAECKITLLLSKGFGHMMTMLLGFFSIAGHYIRIDEEDATLLVAMLSKGFGQ